MQLPRPLCPCWGGLLPGLTAVPAAPRGAPPGETPGKRDLPTGLSRLRSPTGRAAVHRGRFPGRQDNTHSHAVPLPLRVGPEVPPPGAGLCSSPHRATWGEVVRGTWHSDAGDLQQHIQSWSPSRVWGGPTAKRETESTLKIPSSVCLSRPLPLLLTDPVFSLLSKADPGLVVRDGVSRWAAPLCGGHAGESLSQGGLSRTGTDWSPHCPQDDLALQNPELETTVSSFLRHTFPKYGQGTLRVYVVTRDAPGDTRGPQSSPQEPGRQGTWGSSHTESSLSGEAGPAVTGPSDPNVRRQQQACWWPGPDPTCRQPPTAGPHGASLVTSQPFPPGPCLCLPRHRREQVALTEKVHAAHR